MSRIPENLIKQVHGKIDSFHNSIVMGAGECIYTEETTKSLIVKRIYCDCCEAYYDYPLSFENYAVDTSFLCHNCEENVLEDIKTGGGSYLTESGARNTKEELKAFRENRDVFEKNNLCLVSECTDFYEAKAPTIEDLTKYFQDAIEMLGAGVYGADNHYLVISNG